MKAVGTLVLFFLVDQVIKKANGKECVPLGKNEEFPVQYTCDNGYQLISKECVAIRKKPRLKQCPIGTELSFNSQECVKIESHIPKLTCKTGFKLVDGMCVSNEEEASNLVCNKPYRLVGNECIMLISINPQEDCPDGYTYFNGSCIRMLSINSTKYCPEGYLIDDNTKRCLQVLRETPFSVCSDNTPPNSNGMCVKSVVANVIETCPPNSNKVNGKCILTDTIPMTPNPCEGTLRENNECINEIILDASLKCENGFTLMPNGMCQQTISKPPTPVCPANSAYHPIKKKCEIKELILPSVTCSENYNIIGNNCVKTTTTNPKQSCPDLYKIINGICVKQEEVISSLGCPTGFTIKNDECIQTNYKNMMFNCPNGFESNGNQCTVQEETSPVLLCPDGFSVVNKICVIEKSLPAEVVCSKGTKKKGSKCIRTIKKNPIKNCKLPFGLNKITGMCEDKKILDMELFCPSGYTADSNDPNLCVRIDYINPKPMCLSGTIFDQIKYVCYKPQVKCKYSKEVPIPVFKKPCYPVIKESKPIITSKVSKETVTYSDKDYYVNKTPNLYNTNTQYWPDHNSNKHYKY